MALSLRLSWFQDLLEIGKDFIANYENKVYHRQGQKHLSSHIPISISS